jgi:hypothetical protein
MGNNKIIEKTVDVMVMGGSSGGMPAALRAEKTERKKCWLSIKDLCLEVVAFQL